MLNELRFPIAITIIRVSFIFFICNLVMSVFVTDDALAEAPFEGYYRYLFEDGGDYPTAWTETRYSNMFKAMSHDEDNWFMAQSGCKDTFWGTDCVHRLWKIPLEIDLDTNDQSVWWRFDGSQWVQITPPGVEVKYIPDIKNGVHALRNIYELDFYRKDGRGYLFAQVQYEILATGQTSLGFAVLDSDTLTLIDVNPLVSSCLAASPDGRLVTMDYLASEATYALVYGSVDWTALATNGELVTSFLDPWANNRTVPIYLQDGRSLEQEATDCDLSSSGELIYLNVMGLRRVLVASTVTGIVEEISTNHELGEVGYFDIWAMPDGTSADDEFIEALTVWDLDADQRAPVIRGKLHVAVRNWENWELSVTDDIRISHFSEEIWVIDGSTALPERGTANYPYATVAAAAAGASNRSVMYLVGTNFPESVVLDKRMNVVPLFFNPQQTSIVLGE